MGNEIVGVLYQTQSEKVAEQWWINEGFPACWFGLVFLFKWYLIIALCSLTISIGESVIKKDWPGLKTIFFNTILWPKSLYNLMIIIYKKIKSKKWFNKIMNG